MALELVEIVPIPMLKVRFSLWLDGLMAANESGAVKNY